MMIPREIGMEYLDALEEAQDARRKLETNDGDDYDPCGDTKKRVQQELGTAIERLARATRMLVAMAGGP